MAGEGIRTLRRQHDMLQKEFSCSYLDRACIEHSLKLQKNITTASVIIMLAREGLFIAELVLWVRSIFLSSFITLTHGLSRRLGLFSFNLLSTFRIVGSITGIVAIHTRPKASSRHPSSAPVSASSPSLVLSLVSCSEST